ncbi:hypothetical protein CRI94_14380 [Longibacter salinarum]|uniref:Secretion system C-terminal sorting domain-containing protein n=1 Tax=Longibacter salinarum TaxID=1850348 RepID=A0A2A8CUP8_9BACT|nr:T9SS type A sorting domain-containing protein [Longibacter salinarum]PEN12223.1 hypothetical protein CRI94_14380 [Longibacter salinarum]
MRYSRLRFILSLLFLTLGTTLAARPASAQLALRASHVGSGHGAMTGSNYSLRGSAGQPATGIVGSDPYVGQGFWYAVRNENVRLPVELAAFTARPDGEAVHLVWQTVSETGNDGFYVQRQTESGTFSDVDFVAGAGTTTEPNTYRFTDRDLPYETETVTYRLRQVDIDGSETFSETLVTERNAVDQLTLLGTYPNPARTSATARLAVPEGVDDAQLVIYDLLGRKVRDLPVSGSGRHTLTLQTHGLAAGMYFLRLTGGGQVRTQKLTVVR